jgi:4-oxalocrotonate tautomerase
MPLVDIHVIKGAFTGEQKQAMLARVTDAMVSIEGEKLRGLTWVKINEVEGGDWAIGGQALQAADVRKLAES